MKSILPENWLPRKEILDELFMPAVVVLVGVGAFGLGRLSAMEGKRQSLVVRQDGQLASPLSAVEAAPVSHRDVYVASKSGSKYYLSTTCSGAKNIKEENRVFFSSAKAAEAAGYEPAANCPGLAQ